MPVSIKLWPNLLDHYKGIFSYTALQVDEWSRDHCMEGLELKNSNSITFTLDVPKPIEIACSKVTICHEENWIEVVKPWLSETELIISVRGERLPNPADWIRWFSELGHCVGWRYYTGDLTEPSAIPRQEYEGWYLQAASEISRTRQGLFFRKCESEGNSFYILLQRCELSDDIWIFLKKLLLRFKNVEVTSGNCKFYKEQWKYTIKGQ